MTSVEAKGPAAGVGKKTQNPGFSWLLPNTKAERYM
jgi:hypothetical protein